MFVKLKVFLSHMFCTTGWVAQMYEEKNHFRNNYLNGFGRFDPGDLHLWPSYPSIKMDVWTKFEEVRSMRSQVIDRKRKVYRPNERTTDRTNDRTTDLPISAKQYPLSSSKGGILTKQSHHTKHTHVTKSHLVHETTPWLWNDICMRCLTFQIKESQWKLRRPKCKTLKLCIVVNGLLCMCIYPFWGRR